MSMAARHCELGELDCGAKRPLRVTRAGIRHVAVVAIVIAVVVAIVYGESWAITRAPASSVASALAQTQDLRRTLDLLLAAPAQAPGAKSL